MSFSLNEVAKIFVDDVQRNGNKVKYFGKFDKTPLIKKNHLGYLIDGSKFVYGRFIKFYENDFTTIFESENDAIILSKQKAYPVLDGYWGERAELVLDENRKWNKIYFKSTDANKFKLDRVTGWQEIGQELPEGAEYIGTIKNGWDHEHCYLCMQKISESEENNYGFVDDEKNWICKKCYSEYIQNRSLNFIYIKTT